jgi:hypothetical protein
MTEAYKTAAFWMGVAEANTPFQESNILMSSLYTMQI